MFCNKSIYILNMTSSLQKINLEIINQAIPYFKEDAINSQNITPSENIRRVLEETPIPNNIYPVFFNEVKQHLESDFNEIVQTFFVDHDPRVLTKVEITKAGDETHYGGKVALFLTFSFNDNQTLKVLYKPRSLVPDKILEEVLCDVSQLTQQSKKPRQMLLKSDYGYDQYIAGKIIEENEFTNWINTEVKFNKNIDIINLVMVLNFLGFEDVHNQNFILDSKNQLHFIDAEVFNTKVSINMSEVQNLISKTSGKSNSYFNSSDSFKEYQSRVEQISKTYKEKLNQHETRLIVIATSDFPKSFSSLNFDEQQALRRKKIKIGNATFTKISDFKIFHMLNLGSFLHLNGFIKIEKSDLINDIENKINNAFNENNILQLIDEEIEASEQFKKMHTICDEVPVFHFNFNRKMIKCPLTKRELYLRSE